MNTYYSHSKGRILTAEEVNENITPKVNGMVWRGLGDVIASATKAIGIQPCGGCGKRQESLNKAVPFTIASK